MMTSKRISHCLRVSLPLLLCLALSFASASRAQEGGYQAYLPLAVRPVTYDEPVGLLDESFGQDGLVSTDFPGGGNDVANALALQADGKLLAAGYAFNGLDYDFALARYLPDGSLDSTFDGDGWRLVDFGGNDEARALAIQEDGNIVLAGYSDGGVGFDFALARLAPDGSLESSFDQDGWLLTDFASGNDSAYALALQPDGGILLAGYTYLASTSDFALVRYLPDGSLDLSFDQDGWLSLDFAGYGDQAFALALQSDGKVVAAGVAELGTQTADFALARFLTDGVLDMTFSDDGWLLTDFATTYDSSTALQVQPDGKLVALGDSSGDMAVARYLPDGTLDADFGEGGLLRLDFYTLDDSGNALLLQPDGKLLLAGNAHFCHETDFSLARLTSNGGLDRSFEDDGLLLSYLVEINDLGLALLQQPDGKLLLAGAIDNGSDDEFLIARFK